MSEAQIDSPVKRPETAISPNLERLREDYKSSIRKLEQARAVLTTAQSIKNDGEVNTGSSAFKMVLSRLTSGESIDGLLSKSAGEVSRLYKETLGKELPYRRIEVQLLKQEVDSPVTDEDILRGIEAIEKRYAIDFSDPVYEVIDQRVKAGESREQIRQQAQKAVERRAQLRRMVASLSVKGDPKVAREINPGIELIIEEERRRGKPYKQIMKKTQEELKRMDDIDTKKGELRVALRRINEIPKELARLGLPTPAAAAAKATA